MHFDDLDPMGMIHNARYALLIERALATFWKLHGHTFRDGRPTTADAFNVVKEFTISYRAPIRGPGDVVVHFWLEHMGTSCAVYTFCLLSSDHTLFLSTCKLTGTLPLTWTPEPPVKASGGGDRTTRYLRWCWRFSFATPSGWRAQRTRPADCLLFSTRAGASG